MRDGSDGVFSDPQLRMPQPLRFNVVTNRGDPTVTGDCMQNGDNISKR